MRLRLRILARERWKAGGRGRRCGLLSWMGGYMGLQRGIPAKMLRHVSHGDAERVISGSHSSVSSMGSVKAVS